MKKIFVLTLIAACIMLLISCGTSPETPAADPVPAPAPAPVPAPSAPAAVPSPPAIDFSAAKARAANAREQALSIKANVAVKDDFNNAENIFITADTDADPIAAFTKAEELFTAAYDKAKVLRDAAAAELEKARNEIKSAEEEAAAFETEMAAQEEL